MRMFKLKEPYVREHIDALCLVLEDDAGRLWYNDATVDRHVLDEWELMVYQGEDTRTQVMEKYEEISKEDPTHLMMRPHAWRFVSPVGQVNHTDPTFKTVVI